MNILEKADVVEERLRTVIQSEDKTGRRDKLMKHLGVIVYCKEEATKGNSSRYRDIILPDVFRKLVREFPEFSGIVK